jgi:hypothetical protein
MPEVVSGFSWLAAAAIVLALPPTDLAPQGAVERRFQASWSHRAVENRVVVDGRAQPVVPLSGSAFDVEARRERVFVDRPVRRGEDGSLLAFDRLVATATEHRRHTGVQYDRAQRLGDYYPIPVRAESAFDRARIRWTREAADAPFTAELLERGDPERLGELAADGALDRWRPPAAGLGARWSVPAAALGELRGPGGTLGMDDDYAQERGARVDDAALYEAALRELEGELELEVRSLREEAGGRRLVAHLTGEPAGTATWDERPSRERSGRFEVRLVLAGELVWDLERDEVVTLRVQGTSEIVVTTSTEREVGASVREITTATILRGTWAAEALTTPRD